MKLRKAGIRVRLVGEEVANRGISDEDLVRSLRGLKRPVVFSQDEDFFQLRWLHRDYGLVWLDLNPNQVAEYVRRFIHHTDFSTQAQRLGIVARVTVKGIQFWQVGSRDLKNVGW